MIEMPLPFPLAPALPIVPPWVWRLLGWALLGLLLRWWFWRRQRSRGASSLPPPPQSFNLPPLKINWVNEIQNVYAETENYRQGCHALAVGLRRWLEQKTGLPAEEMTAKEISDSIHHEKLRTTVQRLREVRFRHPEPGRADFVELCQATQQVVRSRLGKVR